MIIATRASKLALWQAEHVKNLIEVNFGIKCELKKITTLGDRVLDRSLVEIGGKGLFLKEIEDALIAKEADIAVHSMKDVPFRMPEGLLIAAMLKREDPSDAFVSVKYPTVESLPQEARVGTSSLRRLIQLQQKFPYLKFEPLRGNVDTRLRKLDAGEFDAIVLASAGLKRLGLESRITQKLDLVSAVGQGAIGIECREGDTEIREMLAKLDHNETARAVKIERQFLESINGSCQTPVGCFVKKNSADELSFDISCFLADVDGSNPKWFHSKSRWEDSLVTISNILKDF